MGKRNAFVEPAVVRRELPDSELWVEIKAELTYGEKQRLTGALMAGLPQDGGGPATLDLEGWHVLRLVTWLVDWNFEDGNGKRVALSRDAVRNLRPAVGEALDALLDAYITELETKKVSG